MAKIIGGGDRWSFPFREQMADADCAAACLAMVLHYHGCDLATFEVRRIIEGYGSGQSSKSMIRAARSLGLEADLMSSGLEGLPTVRLPAVIHWKFNHFVVLLEVDARGYWIADPAHSLRRVDKVEFGKAFTGILVALHPGPTFIRKRRAANPRFRAFLRKSLLCRGNILGVFATVALIGILQLGSLVPPYITLYVVDTILPAAAGELMSTVLVLIVCLGLSLGIVAALRSHLAVWMQRRLDYAFLDGFVNHLLSLPVGFFGDRSAANIQSRLEACRAIKDVFGSNQMGLIIDLIMAVGYAVVLVCLSPVFAAFAVALGLLNVLPVWSNHKAHRIRMSAEYLERNRYQALVNEIVGGIRWIKGSGSEERIKREWSKRLQGYMYAAAERGYSDARTNSASATLKGIMPVLLLWASGSLYLSGVMTLGEVLAGNAIALMMVGPMNSLMALFRFVQDIGVNVERVSDVWMHEPEISGCSNPCVSMETSDIEVRNVQYRYPSQGCATLKGVNLIIPWGAKVGIVGPSGSGKSTLLSALLGFIRPDVGEVLVGGHELSSCDLSAYRATVGYVSQDTFIFNGSVRENVALAGDSVSIDTVVRACKIAGIHDMIEALPMKYDTNLGVNGVMLSGGQRQRIAIARGIVGRPSFIILDEATSSLDASTEERVSREIEAYSVTQVVVSHRLATVRTCDLIYVIEDGRVVASGNHDYLSATEGYYRSMAGNAVFG